MAMLPPPLPSRSIYSRLIRCELGIASGPSVSFFDDIRIPQSSPAFNFEYEKNILEDIKARQAAALESQKESQKRLASRKEARNQKEAAQEEASKKQKLAEEVKRRFAEAEEEAKRREQQEALDAERVAREFDEKERKAQRFNPLAGLNAQQLQAVNQFKAICRVNNDDENISLLLTITNWDVNRAIGAFSEGKGNMQQALVLANQPAKAMPMAVPIAKPIQITRITVVLPNGAQINQDFKYDDTLWAVYALVGERVPGQFSLVKQPQRTVYADDKALNLTLQEAGLTPTGVIHVSTVAAPY